ncbi:adenine phosphoribosyltransferase [Mycoplasmopsis synoviae]|uniref:Adenine phosphoribosyltransferase n=3 Tax=Mycoplasmopsis synoviae TaxID=2109 RepID=APT_MYCS5|nr:adenine phosphoribosyltransferase [Mycoplasmopsis synoviae]Q4A577.1 RecName: Full=Adenine phosphoribosyltransferase; Short=APRT [Mycoplasmopsis synoviae 53]AAZ44094.1 adenine phosphoribosyltransferase [Mycoplasmopsis synoviae 53]AKB11409.1 adenine phosphoribosyltransferase [Mycoplasmopsis synoviae ATCC 25204]MBD5788479.1 adenine phosphoribosyltransferase [Mycoplasmopsis synoviae GX11-T]UBX97637.1 adenine phosphoribosyltransferase [Mycoplasmopsis synoviae]UBX98322.1 adenine phosphoribosyltr
MQLKDYVKDVLDFPKKGIVFKDISPLLADKDAFDLIIKEMAKYCQNSDYIVAADARGFIFGAAIAFHLKKPFVMVRKPKKMPGPSYSVSYELEYGHNVLELQEDLIKENASVSIVDDILATGGTLNAMIELLEKAKAKVNNIVVAIDLTKLSQDFKSSLKTPLDSVIKY